LLGDTAHGVRAGRARVDRDRNEVTIEAGLRGRIEEGAGPPGNPLARRRHQRSRFDDGLDPVVVEVEEFPADRSWPLGASQNRLRGTQLDIEVVQWSSPDSAPLDDINAVEHRVVEKVVRGGLVPDGAPVLAEGS